MVLISLYFKSSVIENYNIQIYYPDSGELCHKLMFNSLIHPRNPAKVFSDALQSLFCHEGIVEPGESFHPNHFVPLVFFIPANLKESV